MYEQFKQELRDFFIQYSISADVGKKIWIDWLLKKSGLELKTERFSISGSDKDMYLSIGELPLSGLMQLLKFLEIDEAAYKTNSSIPLNKAFVEKYFSEFKEEWKISSSETPKKILPYQIESQQTLESAAINNISNTASSLFKELKATENEADMQLSLKLLALQSDKIRYYYEENSHFITRLHLDIQDFVNSNSSYKTNENLTNLLTYFVDYAKFNRLEIKQLVAQFFKDLETFVNKFQISETECDVFEHTIYQMAGISEIPQKNKIDTSYSDRTRVNFAITGMSDENLEKLMSYFKSLGDETVIKNPNNRSYGMHLESASIAKSMSVEKAMVISDIQRKVKIKEDTLQMDGEFLAKTVFPLFQAHLSKLAIENPELLKPYQEKSKDFMDALNKLNKKSIDAPVSSLGMFGASVVVHEEFDLEKEQSFTL